MLKKKVKQVIEQLTRKQRDSPLWHQVRKGRITASRVGPLVKAKTKERLDKLQIEQDISQLPAVRWGVRHEGNAKIAYTAKTGNSVQDCGIFIAEDHDWLAGTPDGIVYDKEAGTYGLLEIKCPFSIKDCDPNRTFHKLKYTDKSGNLRHSHDYYYQIQVQLYTSGYSWCDFVIYTPKGLHIQRIHRDDILIETLILPRLENVHGTGWRTRQASLQGT